MATREAYEFGDFRLDPGRRRLERTDGAQLAVNAKAFDALVYLVEHAGEPVTRKALTEALWPKRVVEENNLTQAISALRRTLGDGYIATLAGRGYQFIAEVRLVQACAQPDGDPPLAPSSEAPENGGAQSVAPTPAGTALRSERRGRSAPRAAAVAAAAALTAILAVWAFLASKTGEEEARAPAKPTVTLVVLPFESLSAEAEAFSAGLTDELIVGLQRLPGLRVTARTTSFALRDPARSVPDIAADLGVQYVLEGSIGRDGDRLRVRGQLSDASGFGVWAESYERPLKSIFQVQDEIVSAIAAQLRTPLGLEPATARAGTSSVEAYVLYLQARSTVVAAAVGPAGYARPLALIEQALRLDPQFATAWMTKSLMYSTLYAFRVDGREDLAAAELAAARALEFAPNQGGGYTARALVRGLRGDWLGAELDWSRSRALGFSDYAPYPILLLSAGHLQKGRDTLRELLERDPLNAQLFGFLMLSHEMLGDTAAADTVYDQGRRLFDPWPFGIATSNWILLGRGDVGPLTDDPARIPPPYARLTQLIGDRDRALTELNRAAAEPEYQSPNALGNLGMWAAYFGDAQLALRLLDRAVTGSALLMYLAWLPVFDEVRQLPEFKGLLVDIGLVGYWRASGWPDVCRPVGQNDFQCD